MQYTLIVPPSIETSLTGFAIGATKIIGKTEWRVDIYVGEDYPRIYRAGVRHDVAKVTSLVASFANTVQKQYLQLIALKSA